MKIRVSTVQNLLVLGILLPLNGGLFSGQKASVRMENGLTVVRNPRNPVVREGGANKVSLVEDLNLGRGEYADDDAFAAATFVLPDHEENIIVFDLQDVCFRIFDKSGRFLRRFGKKGQGPDEIQSAAGMMLSEGKDIVLLDSGNNRIAFYSKEGMCFRRIPLTTSLPNFPVLDRRGNFYGADFAFAEKVTLNLIKFGPNGNALATIASIEMPRENQLPPFELMERFVFQIGPDDTLIWGRNFAYELNIADPDGKIFKKIFRDAPPEKVTRAVLEKEYKRRYPDRRIPENLPIPSHYPKYFPFMNSIVCDEEGRLFVATNEGYGSGRKSYDVFDREGFYIARFEIPEEETITAVAKGKAYVMIREDKQGYPRVKRYRIEWT